MNELTKQLQEIMVPKAALIAYEYQEGHLRKRKSLPGTTPYQQKGKNGSRHSGNI